MQHEVDKIYFRVTFCDPDMTFPVVDPFVFLGMNLSEDDDGGEFYYFQNAVNLYKNGDARRVPGSPVSRLTKEHLAGDMLDVPSLVKMLSRSSRVAK